MNVCQNRITDETVAYLYAYDTITVDAKPLSYARPTVVYKRWNLHNTVSVALTRFTRFSGTLVARMGKKKKETALKRQNPYYAQPSPIVRYRGAVTYILCAHTAA